MRARTHVEDIGQGGDRQAIIVDELPYQVNKATARSSRSASWCARRGSRASADLRDESDKSGMRVVIELKRGEVARDRAEQPVQAHADAGDVRHEHGRAGRRPAEAAQPQADSSRRSCAIAARSSRAAPCSSLRKARDRGHVLEGLAVALSNVDEVIALIKAAPTPAAAKERLMARTWRSTLVEEMLARAAADALPSREPAEGVRPRTPAATASRSAQAQKILEMQLQRLTGLEQDKILVRIPRGDRDHRGSARHPRQARARHGDHRRRAREIKREFGDPRRSEIVGERPRTCSSRT